MKKNKKRNLVSPKKLLRAGSRVVKEQLYEENPCCDICDTKLPIRIIQLHHVYLIRHGFPTEKSHCVLLCPTCHSKFHSKFDRYLDKLNSLNHNTDFLAVYHEIKKHLE